MRYSGGRDEKGGISRRYSGRRDEKGVQQWADEQCCVLV